jgi:NAD(P)H-hydrate epimerase
VIDADALNLVSEYQMHDLLTRRGNKTVLTPHPGEMARLLNCERSEIRENPIQALKSAISKTYCNVILKGAASLIGSPDDVMYLNHYPNDGMATAGSGDVLAGMIGGLLGQGAHPFDASLLAVYLHSLAGDLAATQKGHRSMTAQDIIENIGNAFKEIQKNTENPGAIDGHLRLL